MNDLQIVAEIGASHCGNIDKARMLIDAAAWAGADSVKFQTWKKGTMCIDKNYIIEHGVWAGWSLYDLYEAAYLKWEWHEGLFDYARQKGLIPFSSAFDIESVDFLESLGVDRHKVASFELTDIRLIEYMASKKKPLILSTGMATERDISRAMVASSMLYRMDKTLLSCVSAYPSDPADAKLKKLLWFNSHYYGVKRGISDHSMSASVSVAAVALGATYVEKHITLERDGSGLDDGFALEPGEFKDTVQSCREAYAAISSTENFEFSSKSHNLCRSLYVTTSAKAGDVINHDNVGTARPSLGMHPYMLPSIIGRKFTVDVEPGTPLTEDLFD